MNSRPKRAVHGYLAIALALIVYLHRSSAAQVATPLGFDHLTHGQQVEISGAPAIACEQCHKIKNGYLVGRPEHRNCFGACHGPAPTNVNANQHAMAKPKLCRSCHALLPEPAAKSWTATQKPPVAFPPYRFEPDFGIALKHQLHKGSCDQCHLAVATSGKRSSFRPAARPHARCVACHSPRSATENKTAAPFSINDCARCHTQAFGPNATPKIVAGKISTTSAFDHNVASHRTAACTQCHAQVAEDQTDVLPAPAKASCSSAKCHDAASALPVDGSCTKCHRDVPVGTFTVARPTARFSHSGHADKLAIAQCSGCHQLEGTSKNPTSVSHTACSRCHQADFASLTPRICGACHLSSEPWRPLIADQQPSQTPDFGVTLDHSKHRFGTGSSLACTSCHREQSDSLRLARGHGACSACHSSGAGPTAGMNDCNRCHVLDKRNNDATRRQARPWSLPLQFDHAAHNQMASTQCSSCHTATVEIDRAPKAACATCHNGKRAFSVTSTLCAKCHRSK